MKILPAIDILDGSCVRLNKGDYSQVTKYSDDPLSVASQWHQVGIRTIHIVDLDGARAGKPANFRVIKKIREAFDDFYIQVGGGIRTIESISAYVKSGIDKVIIGTKALSSPSFLESIPKNLKEKVIIDIAMNNSFLATDGWVEKSNVKITDFIEFLENNEIRELVVTDINKDGMLSGINIEMYNHISSMTNIPIIVSGGITTLEDVKKIISIRAKGLSGIIIGKAIYENKISISDLVKLEIL
tara:strand:- start:1336 stop:2064 length:729 start_codon:yes stop_codon:yes gene_type:complete